MKEQNLEQKILKVAEQLFMDKGFDATSTTDIAKEVGCNQALIHYYFRTKEKLFQQIFYKKFEDVLITLSNPLFENITLNEKITLGVTTYFDTLKENPKLPYLIINELLTKPERRDFIHDSLVNNPKRLSFYRNFCNLINSEIEKGNIRKINPIDLIINIISLTAFTFITLPIIDQFLLIDNDSASQNNYIEHRKEEIISLIINGIKP
ncbi:MAG: TetR/AcrR family transcriptional regulator [Bacteroidales bacterium]|nr:TetR/AcrR family transcriptional regulator [Bacteroidales bacterium]